MNARTITPGLLRARSWRTRCVAGTSLAVVLSVATLVSGATPSFASSHLKSANGSAYCKLLTAYDKKQTAANKALETPGAAIAAMKAAYKNLQNEEGFVLNVAPSSLQSSYKLVFKDLNTFYGLLAKVDFKYNKLSKAEIASFENLSKAMDTASAKITAYNKNVCGVKD
jgi:hypothetical protein